jgi:hypothetical protein
VAQAKADQILPLRLPASHTLRRLVRIGKCRWKIDQDYQQLKEETGLDHSKKGAGMARTIT